MLKIYKKNVSSILKVGQEKKYISPILLFKNYLDGVFGLLYHKGWDGGQETGAGSSTRLWFTFYTYIICLLGLPLYCIKTNRMIHTMMYDNTRLWAKQHCDHRETQIFVCLLCSFVCFVCLFVCVFFLFVMFASPGFLLPHSSRQARTLLACFAPL